MERFSSCLFRDVCSSRYGVFCRNVIEYLFSPVVDLGSFFHPCILRSHLCVDPRGLGHCDCGIYFLFLTGVWPCPLPLTFFLVWLSLLAMLSTVFLLTSLSFSFLKFLFFPPQRPHFLCCLILLLLSFLCPRQTHRLICLCLQDLQVQ